MDERYFKWGYLPQLKKLTENLYKVANSLAITLNLRLGYDLDGNWISIQDNVK